jgi:threonine/homoserine/homoserine lactone efflux protein
MVRVEIMETLLPLIVYAFVSSATPGPNNIMLTASGANFGFRRTIPHMIGISIGFCFMLAVMGLGLGAVFLAAPQLQLVLKFVGTAYMLWLAWKIANSGAPKSTQTQAAPLTFLQAAAFQWVNVKAWIMGITTIAIYVPAGEGQWHALALAVIIFGLVNLPTVALWAGLGVGVRRFLQNPQALRAFNITMAVLLVASIIPMLR